MRLGPKVIQIIFWFLVAVAIIVVGRQVEFDITQVVRSLGKNSAFTAITIFFSIVILNILLLFVFVFLTFRSGVKLFVARGTRAFGSALRTKLVASFLFFSLLPTVVLLYVSTKFVNANFERWLPESFVTTFDRSMTSETEYQQSILKVVNGLPFKQLHPNTFDFAVEDENPPKIIFNSKKNFDEAIVDFIKKNGESVSGEAKWYRLSDNQLVAVRRISPSVFAGILSPPLIYNSMQVMLPEVLDAQPGMRILRFSFYIMLGVITLLIVFSATWLGFTIAKELTTPLQTLASATEQVAHGNYQVKIDEIVSDDEIGKLALSFRSMVDDLRASRQNAEISAQELKHKADELFEKSEYNAILVRDVNAAVISFDEFGVIETFNNEAEVLFRVQSPKVVGKKVEHIFEKRFYESAVMPLLELLVNSEGQRQETEYVGRVGATVVQLKVVASAIRSPSGRAGTVLFMTDLTEFSKNQRLAAWRDVARRIAHEIKNPLTPIKLGAQRLERKFASRFEGNERQIFSECTKVILQATQSIQLLVNEFVQFARLPPPNMREANFIEVVQLAVAGLSENAEQVPVTLSINDIDSNQSFDGKTSEVPVLILRCDPDQMGRMLSNLIANAVAATEANGPAVEVVCSFSRTQKKVLLSVKDQGSGVPDDVKEKIFEPYFSTKRTGSGLGLVIVKQIVNEHLGKVKLEDNSPKGSIFVVDLPLT